MTLTRVLRLLADRVGVAPMFKAAFPCRCLLLLNDEQSVTHSSAEISFVRCTRVAWNISLLSQL